MTLSNYVPSLQAFLLPTSMIYYMPHAAVALLRVGLVYIIRPSAVYPAFDIRMTTRQATVSWMRLSDIEG
jgi:hypothetical protein